MDEPKNATVRRPISPRSAARLRSPARRDRSMISRASSRKTRPASVRIAPLGVRTKSVTFSRSEEHTSELQSLMRISYVVFCLNKNKRNQATKRKRPHTKSKNIYKIPTSYTDIETSHIYNEQ